MELHIAPSRGALVAASPSPAGRQTGPSLPLQKQRHIYLRPNLRHRAHTTIGCKASLPTKYKETPEVVDLDWENLGFGLVNTDLMYMAKCGPDGKYSKGEVSPFGPIGVRPSAGVLNYGQGLFEGLKAYRKTDGSILLFRPEENAIRMLNGSDRMCMPATTVQQFLDAVKQTVSANKRWVPPTGIGSLYTRTLLNGSGAILGLAPAPEYTFLIHVSPVGNYFKEGLAPINLIGEDNFYRVAPGVTGGVKTIGNYALVLKAQTAKEKGYSVVLYLDAVDNKYLEEVSSCNIFVVKGNTISTPAIEGTILPGITRKSIIQVAESKGYKVEERPVSVDELLGADKVFCTGTAVVVSPVGSTMYLGKRVEYAGNRGVGVVSQQLYTSLTRLQMVPRQVGRTRCTPVNNSESLTNKNTKKANFNLNLHIAVALALLTFKFAKHIAVVLNVDQYISTRVKFPPILVTASTLLLGLSKCVYTVFKETKDYSQLVLYFTTFYNEHNTRIKGEE